MHCTKRGAKGQGGGKKSFANLISSWGGAAILTLFLGNAVPVIAQKTFVVETGTIGRGSVRMQPPGGSYYEGTVLKLVAEPAPGHVLVGWDNQVIGYSNPAEIMVDGDLQINAIFATIPTPRFSSGIFASADEVNLLPDFGIGWQNLKREADLPAGSPNLSDQTDNANVRVLAKALVYARTGIEAYRTEVIEACMAAIGTEEGGRALALGRELGAYVVAADLVKLPESKDAIFRPWLRELLTKDLNGRSLQSTHEDRPNNWGTQCGSSRAAVAVYLNDAVELARTARVFQGYLGDREAYHQFKYGDLSWQGDPANPVGINASGAAKEGHSIDGVPADDQRRSGPFVWPPPKTNYYYAALQGAMVQAVILHRAGYDVWEWQDKALLRAWKWVHEQADFPAEGDDIWLPYIANHFYGTNFPAAYPAVPGKNSGWTDWLYGGPFALNVEVSHQNGGKVDIKSLGVDNQGRHILQLHAVVNSQFIFTGWSGASTDTTNPLTITLDADKAITANLTKLRKLTATAAGSGRVEVTPSADGGIYPDGTVVSVEATPDAGYVFNGWSGDLSGTRNPETIIMDDDKDVSGIFSQTGGDGTTTFRFEPSDDSQVKSTRPNDNYGDQPSFKIDADAIFNSYLKFQVNGLLGQIQTAKIRLFVVNGGEDGGSLYSVSNDFAGTSKTWTERELTWQNAPLIGGLPLASVGAVNDLTFTELDVTVVIHSDDVYSFGITNNSSDKVEYSSKEGSTAPELIIITKLAEAGQAPVARDDSLATREDTPAEIAVLENDSDADGSLNRNALVIVRQPAHGTATIDAPTGIVEYFPGPNFNGLDSFKYNIADDAGLVSNDATVYVVVTPENDAPLAMDDSAATNENIGVSIDVVSNDRDIDGTLDLTSLVIVRPPRHGSVQVTTQPGIIAYVPAEGFSGSDSLEYTVADNDGLQSNRATVRVLVTHPNEAPVAINDTASTLEDNQVAISILANDRDSDGALEKASIKIERLPEHGSATVDSSLGQIRYLPARDYFGSDSLTYTVRDNLGAVSNEASVFFHVTSVNDGPVAVDDAETGDANMPVEINVTANDFDVDGMLDLSSIAIISPPQHGTIIAGNQAGSFSYLPQTDFSGTDSFQYTVKDNEGAVSRPARVVITILEKQGQKITFPATDDGQVRLSQPGNNYGTKGTAKVESGEFESYFKFAVSGLSGTVRRATLTLHVSSGSTDGSDLGGIIYLSSNNFRDTEVPWVEEELTAANSPDKIATALQTVGAVPPNEPVDFDVTAAVQGNGVYSFCLTSTSGDQVRYDTKEGDIQPELTIETGSGSGPVNFPPTAADDEAVATAGIDVQIDILANDSDGDGTLDRGSIFIIGPPNHGVASSVANTGQVTYRAESTFSGQDQFTYTVDDNLGATSNVALVSVAVSASEPENMAPIAQHDTVITVRETPVNIDVTANDYDPDGSINRSSIVIVEPPLNGQVTNASQPGVLVYSPSARFSGTDFFDYAVSDDKGASSNTAKVTITVAEARETQIAVFIPTDDAQVKLTEPSSNYGGKSASKVEKNKFSSYYKFSIAGVSGPVHRAILRLRVGSLLSDGGDNGGTLYLTENTLAASTEPWTEATLTSGNAPAIVGEAIASTGAVAPDDFVEFDVRSVVPGPGIYSFCLESSSDDQVKYYTKEGETAPQIRVEFLLAGPQPSAALVATDNPAMTLQEPVLMGQNEVLPTRFALHANFPNPFNAGTSIEYDLPRNSLVKLQIFNMRGQLVRTLVDGLREAGRHRLRWFGDNQKGLLISSGTYFLQLRVADQQFVRKLLLQK